MLTEDVIEVKKNKKKYKMGYSPETLSYPHKVKDIYEAKDEAPKKEKKKKRDPRYQRMINKAKVLYPYVDNEDDAIARWLQDTGYNDHEHNLKQQKEIDSMKKGIADLQDELHELKRSLKTKDRPDTWRTRDNDSRKR